MEIGKAIYANQEGGEGGDAPPEGEQASEEPKQEENTEEKKEEEPKKDEEKKWVVWCKSNCGFNFQKASRGHPFINLNIYGLCLKNNRINLDKFQPVFICTFQGQK